MSRSCRFLSWNVPTMKIAINRHRIHELMECLLSWYNAYPKAVEEVCTDTVINNVFLITNEIRKPIDFPYP